MTETQWVSKLLKWFRTSGKNYSFRATSDPYRILITSMLLRQTTATQVASVYWKFFKQFPTPKKLSRASEAQLTKILRPLGIRSRARNLQQTASVLTKVFHGKIPSVASELEKLPGVGPYTSGRVMTLGFDRPIPIVDVNIARVFSRVYGFELSKYPLRKLSDLYGEVTPKGREPEFHFGVIDLSHAYCRSKNPLCEECPIRTDCCYGSSRKKVL